MGERTVPAASTSAELVVASDKILRIHGAGPAAAEELRRVAARDAEVGTSASNGCMWALIKTLLVGVAGFVGCVLGTIAFPPLVLGFPVLVLGCGVAIWRSVSAYNAAMATTIGCTGTRLTMVQTLLDVLQHDADTKKGLTVTCDFRDSTRDERRVDHQDNPGGFFAVSTAKNKYVDDWFSADVRMADGNRVKFSIQTTVHEKVKYKKRTRRRNRYDHAIDVRLVADPASFKGFRPADAVVGSRVGSATVESIQIDGHELRATCRTQAADVSADDLLTTLSACYALLVPLKRRVKHR